MAAQPHALRVVDAGAVPTISPSTKGIKLFFRIAAKLEGARETKVMI